MRKGTVDYIVRLYPEQAELIWRLSRRNGNIGFSATVRWIIDCVKALGIENLPSLKYRLDVLAQEFAKVALQALAEEGDAPAHGEHEKTRRKNS